MVLTSEFPPFPERLSLGSPCLKDKKKSLRRVRPIALEPPPGFEDLQKVKSNEGDEQQQDSKGYTSFVTSRVVAGLLDGDWSSGRPLPKIPVSLLSKLSITSQSNQTIPMRSSVVKEDDPFIRNKRSLEAMKSLDSRLFTRNESAKSIPKDDKPKRRLAPTHLTTAKLFSSGGLWKQHFGDNMETAFPFVPLKLSKKSQHLETSDGNKISPPLESSPEHKIAQRQRQIDIGKNTPEYYNYRKRIPRRERKRSDAVSPDKYQMISKRNWEGQVKAWRRLLHKWDPVEPLVIDEEEGELPFWIYEDDEYYEKFGGLEAYESKRFKSFVRKCSLKKEEENDLNTKINNLTVNDDEISPTMSTAFDSQGISRCDSAYSVNT
jgi:hypothetical protein